MQTETPSPFAASLQFGFVMDWLYGDDTPRAEQRAALLSLDRSLLGEVMGEEAGDDITLDAIVSSCREKRIRAGATSEKRRRARAFSRQSWRSDRSGARRTESRRMMRVFAADPFSDSMSGGEGCDNHARARQGREIHPRRNVSTIPLCLRSPETLGKVKRSAGAARSGDDPRRCASREYSRASSRFPARSR